jgi:hypothetical protein
MTVLTNQIIISIINDNYNINIKESDHNPYNFAKTPTEKTVS